MEIYVHIPFCKKKCKYCDFASFDDRFDKVGAYFNKLSEELRLKAQKYKGEEITSVYFGGGTPTSVNSEHLVSVLCEIKSLFDLSDDAEITVEANPGTLDKNSLNALKKGGFNRISIGAQSFNDEELRRLGRIHDSKTAIECIRLSKEVFDNVSADLIIGLEGQTEEKVKANLDRLIALNVDHISSYMLIVEDGTDLQKLVESGEYKPLNDDKAANLYNFVNGYLKANGGYKRYEISNFAKNGKISKHNMGYWKMENYIGVGLAAHSLVKNRRFYNTSDLVEYLKNPIEEISEEELSEEEYEREYIMLSFRTSDGVNKREYKQKFGVDFEEKYARQIKELKECLEITSERVALSEDYFVLSNQIMLKFI